MPGHRKVYGVNVPDAVFETVKREAQIVRHRYKQNLPVVRVFIRWMLERAVWVGVDEL